MAADKASDLLAGTALFGRLDPKALQVLAEQTVRRSLDKGEILFRQGDGGESLYVVIEGLLKVSVSSGDGGDMVLTTLKPPDVFGELSLIDKGPRSASAVAVEPTTLLALDRRALLDVMRRYPKPVDDLLRSLGALIRRLTDQAADLVFLDLNGRVAKLLVTLADREGSDSTGSISFDLHLTQSDLAEMVGGSRQSVNQILHAFERRGFLELHGREISILDIDALRRRAGM
jgi:CRP-like cAMP-binding protein